jgi:hypothetical protein
MNKVWGLKLQSRGSRAQDVQNDLHQEAEAADYDALAETDSDSGGLAVYRQPLRTDEQESSRAALQSLRLLQRRHRRSAFALGVVFSISGEHVGDGKRYKCNFWLVAAPAADHVFCVRIKTYHGHGIAHLAAGTGQRDIDAHAVLHVSGEPPFRSAAEPPMKKEPLAVGLEAGIDGNALSPMSRACFMGHEPMPYDTEATIIGRLDAFSLALLEIYENELSGGASSQG